MSLISQLVEEIEDLTPKPKWKKFSEEHPDPIKTGHILAWDIIDKKSRFLHPHDLDHWQSSDGCFYYNSGNPSGEYHIRTRFSSWCEIGLFVPPEEFK